MQPGSRIYVAGHTGLVGSALVRRLCLAGHDRLVTRTHAAVDLTDAHAVRALFEAERPEYVFLAAARVGGILANQSRPAEFIRDNLAIQTNVIHEAWRAGVKRLLFLGSSCVYPKFAEQPLDERALLTGPLEPTNRPYALAKIAGIEMCWSYNRQYGTRCLAVMPTNLYGSGDNYHPTESHVIPALLRRFDEAKRAGQPCVTVWGSGKPRREFLFSDDMADACLFLMALPDERFVPLLGSDEATTGRFEPPLVNIGCGEDVTIEELARLIAATVGYKGRIEFDPSHADGTPRKLLDVGLLQGAGWRARTPLVQGLQAAYAEFVTLHRQ